MSVDIATRISGMTGEKAVPLGAAEQIIDGGSTFSTTDGTLVQALKANTATVYVGGDSVTTTNGLELEAGDSIFIPTNDPSDIWVVALVPGQKVRGLGV